MSDKIGHRLSSYRGKFPRLENLCSPYEYLARNAQHAVMAWFDLGKRRVTEKSLGLASRENDEIPYGLKKNYTVNPGSGAIGTISDYRD